MEQDGEGSSSNKRKRASPLHIISETFAKPQDVTNCKKLKTATPTKRRRAEEEDEEEREGSQPEERNRIDSQSQSQEEFEGFVAPPPSPHVNSPPDPTHHSATYLSADNTLRPSSPRKPRALTPQNSSTNLGGLVQRSNSDLTKKLLNATREALLHNPPALNDSEGEGERPPGPREVGYIHTPLLADQKPLKAKKQDLKSALSPEYWRKVCPKLHVQDPDFVIQAYSKFRHQLANQEALASWQNDMSDNGYYETGVLDWGFKIKALASAIAKLRKLGWHPIWIVMFDEAWLLASCMAALFRKTVNTKLDFNADFWAWYLDPMMEEKGWEVHRDRFNMPLAESGEPHYATAWIPLTDATPKNGCIYVVPARYDPDYASLRESTDFDVQNVRAVPAKAGSVLVWSGRTLHFGGRADKDAKVPRISMSLAASTPAFEDPKMRFLFKKDQMVLTVDDHINEVPVVNGGGVCGGSGGVEKGKEKETVVVDERRTSFTGKETVTLPGMRTRLGVVATQLWTYEHRMPIHRKTKELLRSLEAAKE